MTTREDLDQEISTTEKQIDAIVETLSNIKHMRNMVSSGSTIRSLDNAREFWESHLSKLMDYRRTLR